MPDPIMDIMMPFAPVFQQRTSDKIPMMLVGAILAPDKRTVSSILRVMGLSAISNFARYHHVLSRAVWSSLRVSQTLLRLLLAHLDGGQGPLVFGLDETIERRRDGRLQRKASTGMRSAPARAILSRPVACAGSV